jgi:hypothetical protein
MSSHYGDLRLFQVNKGDDFLLLLHEMMDDKSEFVANAGTMIDAMFRGEIWSVEMEETSLMRQHSSYDTDPLFCRDMFGNFLGYKLPCFCWSINNHVVLLWVHSRARKKGIGRFLVTRLGIRSTSY